MKQLADECQRLGAEKLTVASLGNIERGGTEARRRRDVTVDEVFVLGYALGVPPLLMMIPLGDNEPLSITSTAALHPHLAWQSSTGRSPLAVSGNLSTRLQDTERQLQLIRSFDELMTTQEAFTLAVDRLRFTEQHASQEKADQARDAVAEALSHFARAVEHVMRLGFDVPPYSPDTVNALITSGMVTQPDRLETWNEGDKDGER
jgi:hypothetical protein